MTIEIPQEVVQNLLATGLLIVGGKGCGKTNACKVVLQQLLKQPNISVKAFDTVANWRFNFINIPYLELNENTINDIWEIPLTESMIYDIGFIEPTMRRGIIGALVLKEKMLRREEKIINNGVLPNWIVYTIEEAQNIIGTNSISSVQGRFWLDFVSECRNYGQSFVFIGQRIADISAKAVERCQGTLVGRMTGDNDLKKLNRILGKELTDRVPYLKLGQFIYYNGEKKESLIVDFPLFKSELKPYPYKQTSTSWWRKIYS